MPERFVSLTEFVSAGLINDRDVDVIDARFTTTDYDGAADEDVTVLELTLKAVDDDSEHVQMWSVGGGGSFKPSRDGARLVTVGSRNNIALGSNYQIFIESLKANGMTDEISEEPGFIKNLIGTRAHLVRKPAPPRSGMPNTKRRKKDDDQPDRPAEVPVFETVHWFAWDDDVDKKRKKAGASAPEAGSGSTKKAKAKAEAEDVDPKQLAGELIRKALEADGGELATEDLTMAVFALSKKYDKAVRNELAELAGDDDFLAELEGVKKTKGGWELEG
jgi:hypothetical protein